MSMRTGFSSAYRINDGSAQAKPCPGAVRWAVQGFLVDRSINCSYRTIEFYKEKLDKFLGYLDQIRISNLNQLDHSIINGYFNFARKQGQSAANSHCVGRAVKAFLHWAADEELVSPAIVTRMKLPKPPRKVIRPFSIDDIQRLLDAAKQGKQPARDTAILLVLFDTGIRAQELCNLRDDDLDGDRLLINGKGAKQRWIRISPITRRAIWKWQSQRGPSEWMFTGWGVDKIEPKTLINLFVRLKERAGIQGVRVSPHTCRHTFAIEMLRAGADSFEVQKMLGHESLTMTLNYAKLDDADVAKVHKRCSLVERLGKRR